MLIVRIYGEGRGGRWLRRGSRLVEPQLEVVGMEGRADACEAVAKPGGR